jgi:hypothetical protein
MKLTEAIRDLTKCLKNVTIILPRTESQLPELEAMAKSAMEAAKIRAESTEFPECYMAEGAYEAYRRMWIEIKARKRIAE